MMKKKKAKTKSKDAWAIKTGWLQSDSKRKRDKVFSIQNIVLLRTKTGYKLTFNTSRKLNNKELREAVGAAVGLTSYYK